MLSKNEYMKMAILASEHERSKEWLVASEYWYQALEYITSDDPDYGWAKTRKSFCDCRASDRNRYHR